MGRTSQPPGGHLETETVGYRDPLPCSYFFISFEPFVIVVRPISQSRRSWHYRPGRNWKEGAVRLITISVIATALLVGGLASVPLVPASEPPSQSPSTVTGRGAEKKTGMQEAAPASREEKDASTGPGDVQERAIRQGAAPGESPVCVCTSTAGQCVFSAVHGCVPSQGPVGCNSGCFEQKPQLGKVRPSVLPKAEAPGLQHRGVEGEQPPSSEKEGK